MAWLQVLQRPREELQSMRRQGCWSVSVPFRSFCGGARATAEITVKRPKMRMLEESVLLVILGRDCDGLVVSLLESGALTGRMQVTVLEV